MGKYGDIIASIFEEKYSAPMDEVPFARDDLVTHARRLGITPPKNLGDILNET